jgi:hypothetical protein
VVRKGVFVHVHKCGGHTIKVLLFAQNGQARRADCYTLCGPLYANRDNYHPAHRWEIEDWDERWKFTIIRNPFDRLVSAWRFACRPIAALKGQPKFDGSFEEFVRIAFDPTLPAHVHGFTPDMRMYIKTHTAPLVSEGYYLPLMDFIGRYENYQQDVEYIMRELGHPNPSRIIHTHKMRDRETPHYSTYYDSMTRELAERHYWADCEVYGYRFEEAA